MNAQIDIKTPSGQSLEGFPTSLSCEETDFDSVISQLYLDFLTEKEGELQLHKGDKITIEIL